MSVYSRNSPRRGGPGSPRHAVQVDDTPILEFQKVVENTPAGAWQKRTTAFENLIKQVPDGSDYNAPPLMWYNNPPTLRHLANPISELLKDPRSTVVKRTCGSLLTLFSRAQANAKYLFKDLMPTVLSVHAQTVQVIRQAVQFMVMEAIPEVPCKMVMPLWMERLKIDKSRTVRDACAVYLGHALESWDLHEGYLTEEIWMQVGKTLIGSLRDPSPNVRSNSKQSLENFQRMQPLYWDKLINDPDGPAARDAKLNKWLQTLGTGNHQDMEELSVMSRFSYNSDMRSRGRGMSSGASVGSQRSTPRRAAPSPRQVAVPSSIALGRRASPAPNLPPSGKPAASKRAELFQRPPPIVAPTTPSPSKSEPLTSPLDDSVSPMANGFTPENQKKLLDGDEQDTPNDEGAFPSDLGVPALRTTLSGDADKAESNGATTDLQEISKRRNRNSVLIQQRLRMSSSNILDDHPKENDGGDSNGDLRTDSPMAKPPAYPPKNGGVTQEGVVPPPEHMVIAIRLLKAHKAHVDAIMETLRIEMDTLRDFDRLLEEPGRPTEDEVLDYFESVGLCLEQRTIAGVQMQDELDRVSRGEPPTE